MMREVFGLPGNPPELLARIQAPTCSSPARMTPRESTRLTTIRCKRSKSFPAPRLMTIPGAGHMVLVEQPEAGTAAITAFIRAVSAA